MVVVVFFMFFFFCDFNFSKGKLVYKSIEMGGGGGVELEMSCHSISVYFLRPSTEYSNS